MALKISKIIHMIWIGLTSFLGGIIKETGGKGAF